MTMLDINKILRTQPLLKNIDKDLLRIKKIHHLWQDWIQSTNNQTIPLKKSILMECIPTGISKNTLTIVCNSPSVANHIRFTSQTLIQSFIEHGIVDITKIHAVVSSEISTTNSNQLILNKKVKRQVSNDSIELLKQLQRSCSSEKLSSSLDKLLNTLSKNQQNINQK